VPQYFNSVSIGLVLNQPDSPDFAWRTKNLLWDELNVLKRKSNVKTKQGIDEYRLKTSIGWLKWLFEEFRKESSLA
jgi:hypothetical protein